METLTTQRHAHRLARAAVLFVAIGLVLYALLYVAAERIMERHGDSNAFFRIERARPTVDWIVLGASHALPLGYGGFGETMQRETGLAIVNLATTGAGPMYNRLVLEHFLREHRTAGVLYVVDSFAFYSRGWNEERFADAKLLARTPFDLALADELATYVLHDGVGWRTWLDYASGFSKINNRDRFEADRWEGAAQFERAWRPSATAVKKRMDYLYPDGTNDAALERYLSQFDRLARTAQAAGASVIAVKLPTPTAYASKLPDEAKFVEAFARASRAAGVQYLDLSAELPDPKYYFDSDHLNRDGVTVLFERKLKEIFETRSTQLAGR